MLSGIIYAALTWTEIHWTEPTCNKWQCCTDGHNHRSASDHAAQ